MEDGGNEQEPDENKQSKTTRRTDINNFLEFANDQTATGALAPVPQLKAAPPQRPMPPLLSMIHDSPAAERLI